MHVEIDQELTHIATDASSMDTIELLIQPDYHGLSIELPNGQLVILDYNAGNLNIYQAAPGEDPSGHRIGSISTS